MANRSFVKDVLQALDEIDKAFTDIAWRNNDEVHAAMSKLWRIVGGLEATALRRASAQDHEAYLEAVIRPRARRTTELIAELVPAPRTDKDGIPW
jgi:hypothetical protein